MNDPLTSSEAQSGRNSSRDVTNMSDFIIRDYTPQDSDACKDLEIRAQQSSKWVRLFFGFFFTHKKEFHVKASQFESHIILVVEDTSIVPHYVCGVVCVGIKTVFLNSRPARVGYLFDLRIAEKYQGRGLGRDISTKVEQACQREGVEIIYLTVNGNNRKAKALYRKLQYCSASVRMPMATPILSFMRPKVPHPVEGATIKMLSPMEAEQVLTREFTNVDLALVDLTQLLQSPYYIASYQADDGTSQAGMSLWEGSALASFEVEKIFLPMSWWKAPPIKFLLFAIPLALFGYGVYGDYTYFKEKRYVAGGFLAAFLLLIGALAFNVGMWFRGPVGRRLVSEGPVRARLFAPYIKGPKGLDLFRMVQQRVFDDCKRNGFTVSILNVDEHNPIRGANNKKKSFVTLFMQKVLIPGQEGSHRDPFDPNNFHDPRDI